MRILLSLVILCFSLTASAKDSSIVGEVQVCGSTLNLAGELYIYSNKTHEAVKIVGAGPITTSTLLPQEGMASENTYCIASQTPIYISSKTGDLILEIHIYWNPDQKSGFSVGNR